MIVIVAGTIGRSGLGGQAWAGMQYLLGLQALGHEVYYLEDCGRSSWAYIWETCEWTHELDYPAAFVESCLTPVGFGDRWIYRDNYRSLGMPLASFLEVCAGAELYPPDQNQAAASKATNAGKSLMFFMAVSPVS